MPVSEPDIWASFMTDIVSVEEKAQLGFRRNAAAFVLCE